jgi:hypothetical protein
LPGCGGSIVTLPVLVYAAPIPVTQAAGISLVASGEAAAATSGAMSDVSELLLAIRVEVNAKDDRGYTPWPLTLLML